MVFTYDVEEQLKTFDKIEALQGKLFIPSHVAPVTDIKETVKANRDKTLEIMAYLEKITESPMTFEDIFKGCL